MTTQERDVETYSVDLLSDESLLRFVSAVAGVQLLPGVIHVNIAQAEIVALKSHRVC